MLQLQPARGRCPEASGGSLCYEHLRGETPDKEVVHKLGSVPHPEQGRQRDLDKWKVMRNRFDDDDDDDEDKGHGKKGKGKYKKGHWKWVDKNP